MKKTVAAITALIMLLLCSCALKNEPLQPAIEQTEPAVSETAETAGTVTEEPTEEAQPAESVKADRAGFDYTPGVILPPSEGLDYQESSVTGAGLYGYGIRIDKYYEDWFEGQNKVSDTNPVAAAFCLVKVNGVKTDDVTDKMHEPDPSLSSFTYYESTAEVEIEKVMRATDNVSKSRIKEGETVDTTVLYKLAYDGDGKLISRINIDFPVIEIGSEYLVFMLDSFGENKYTLMLVMTVPINDSTINEDYLKYYTDNYPILENAYKLAKKYLNEFLHDLLSDPRMPEKFEEPTFELYYPAP